MTDSSLSDDELAEPTDRAARHVLDRYLAAFENSDLAETERLLADDAILEITGTTNWYSGKATCVPFIAAQAIGQPGDWRISHYAPAVNWQPAPTAKETPGLPPILDRCAGHHLDPHHPDLALRPTGVVPRLRPPAATGLTPLLTSSRPPPTPAFTPFHTSIGRKAVPYQRWETYLKDAGDMTPVRRFAGYISQMPSRYRHPLCGRAARRQNRGSLSKGVYEWTVELGAARDIPESLSDLCHRDRLALVVYDMQIGVLSQLGDAKAIVTRVVEVLEAARAGGYPIFFLRHMFLPNRLKGVFGLRMAMAWQQVDSPAQLKEFLLRDSPEFALVPEMCPRPDEAILDKTTMSAFEGTPLGSALRDLGMTAFAIVGVALEVGIEPTVRHGMDLGFIPVVVSDACGGRDRSAMDRALAGFAFEGSSVITELAAITPLLRGSVAQ